MTKENTSLNEPILQACKRLRNSIAILACVELIVIALGILLLSKRTDALSLFIFFTSLVAFLLLNGFRQRIPSTEEKLWRFRKSDANTVPLILLICFPIQFISLLFFFLVGIFSYGTFLGNLLFLLPFLFMGCATLFYVRFATWRKMLLNKDSKETIIQKLQKASKNIDVLFWLLAAVIFIRASYLFSGLSGRSPAYIDKVCFIFSIISFAILLLYCVSCKVFKSEAVTKNRYVFNSIIFIICTNFLLDLLFLYSMGISIHSKPLGWLVAILCGAIECYALYRFYKLHIAQSLHSVVKWKDTVAVFLQQNFSNDPLFSTAFGDDEKGTEAMQKYFYYTVDYCDHYGRVNVNGDIDSVLAWVPIDYFPPQPDISLSEFHPEALHRFEKHEHTPESIIDENGTDYGYIWALAVSPIKRGQGLASQMLSQATMQMKNWDLTECWLTTEEPTNQYFYQKNKFVLFEKVQTELGLTTFVFKKNSLNTDN